MQLSVLDVARTAYVGLSPALRQSLGPLLGLLPVRLRYGKKYVEHRHKIETVRRRPGLAERIQRQMLLHVLRNAYEKSPYYRGSLRQVFGADLQIDDLLEPGQWTRIPVIDSKVVARERERMCTRPVAVLDKASTGGSSGQPLSFYTDKDRSPVEYAYVMDAWSRLGMSENDWFATFRGFQIPNWAVSPFDVEPGIRELRFSVFHLSDDLMPIYWREIEQRGIRFMKGYPSALGIFARFAAKNSLVNRGVQGIMLHSEFIHDSCRQTLAKVFPNAQIGSFFGLSEKCAFAVERHEHAGHYLFNPIYGVTELVDEHDRPVTEPGARGRIVSTGLLFSGMPLIRYATGDEATLVELPSADNGFSLELAGIRSRIVDEYFVTRSNYLVHSNCFFMMEDELACITDLQFVQTVPGVVEMRCVLVPGRSAATLDDFASLVAEKSRGEITLEIVIVERIPTTHRGKKQAAIQHLDTRGHLVMPTLDGAGPC